MHAAGVAVPVSNGLFGNVMDRLILLDEVACNGTEETLLECKAEPFGSHNCANTEDAGVYCPGMPA